MTRGDAEDTWGAISQALRPLSESSPGGASRWEVTVLLDAAPSMAVWSDIVDGVVEVLRGHADFGDVTVLPLDASTMDDTGPDRSIVGPGRIVLILTDGTGPAWHAGTMLPLLSAWGRRSPIAILDLLPQLQWYRTGIRPRRLRMWLPTPAPASANADFAWEMLSPVPEVFDEPVGDDPVPVPVLELDSRWLAAWATLLTGGGSRLPALLANDSVPQDVTVPATAQDVSARTRVREFTAWATPTAVTLATQLAAAPLNLALMRSVQRALIPEAQTSHLSEILNSELLYPVSAAGAVPEGAGIAYEFHRGVREELLAAGRRADAARVLRVVDEQLGPNVPAVRGLSRMLDDPDASPMSPVTPETAPFIRVERAVLRALSGRYLARARHLHEALGVEPELSSVSATTGTSFATMESAAPGTTDRRSEGAGVSSSRVADVTTSPRTPAKAPAIWGNVPPRNPNFTGREALLANLHEQMRVGTTAVLPHALQGMGGVGKSQLAVEYVYRHQHEYDVVWWIPSERPAQIGNALAELAQRLQLPVGPEANAAVPAVREALRLGQPYANWLLIFDNAESPEAVQRYFPNGGPGHIMVTSRNPQWSSIAQQLEVDVFARRESVDLLRRRGPELNDDDAIRLAEALGDLPLALDQAAAWRAETGMPADEYLRLFEQKRTELLEVSVPLDYQLPVAAAWNVSLDRLADSSPGALRLLQVCSFFAPEPIPRTLFSRGRASDVNPELDEVRRDPMRLNRAIREINRYALAKIDYRTNSIQMHRLVQAVLMDRLDDAEQGSMRRSAHLLLADGDPNDPNSPDSWRAYADLYPHAMTAQAFRSTEPWVQQLVDNLSRYLYWWGDHHAAFELATRAYEARREQLGATHQSTLRMGHWVGWLLFVLGRFDDAARLNQTVLNAYRETVEEDNEDLLRALGAVAADRRVAGDFKGALELAEEVYQRHVRALGPDDVETITAAHNLAVSLRLTGELLRASEIDEENQRLRIQLYGTEHPITLESTRNLITDRCELGDYVSARSEAQAVADQLSHQLTPGHPQTLRAMRTLAVALRKAGDHRAARRISEEVQEGFLTRYGEDHPDTIAASLNLSSDLRETGDLDSAAELGERVYERYRRLLGSDRHPHVIAAKLNWAVTQRLRGRVDEARQMDEEGFAELREQLGDDHPLTLSAALNLASDLYAQGEYALAVERDTDAIERLARVLGPNHPTTLAGQGNRAMDLLKLGRLEESAEVHSSAVENFRRLLGDDHPATAVAVDLTLRANCDMDPLPL
ncbi:FxSxx-COOH system tetratricopeptide repeat protein [Paractinoplanes brasiliensis]|uniref:Tetratricopeptide repeat protein n=1 Tax=Paractinoplanes brasiliensis TaxID=52695 RepID=A0A4R6JBS0_9ACTN|nr:FxSxx-COOH system tetratricopeptide repeat protein [Actinoplanes brasiliensis]TDO32371.1 tetratricopeptide repeat protein [Actinoplanes brasiliensis]GID27762.1 cytochrome c [Actinoplanes brasiliensis]